MVINLEKSLTDFLMEKERDELNNLIDRYNIPKQQDTSKQQLVNDIELYMRSKDFHEKAEEKIVHDMLIVLDILISNENKLEYEKLKEQFLSRKEVKEEFKPLIIRMEALGLIFEEKESGKTILKVPKEFTLWLERYIGQNL
jgi:hypothetical protein